MALRRLIAAMALVTATAVAVGPGRSVPIARMVAASGGHGINSDGDTSTNKGLQDNYLYGKRFNLTAGGR